jgi:enoyl-CoA hydratase
MSVSTERRGRVLVVRMQRAEKRNAVDAEMTAGLDAALNLLDDDPGLWAGVITGDGGVFCAGTDLLRGPGEPTERGGYYGVVERRRATPLIAAVEGLAFGGGFEIALACDLVVAARNARFALPEAARGVIATSGGLFRAQRALPLNIAREMLLTGEHLDAERAWSLGLVNALADEGCALDVALSLAERIVANSPLSIGVTREVMESAFTAADEAGWEETRRGLARIAGSQDAREGVAAFFDGRAPQWTGH